MRRRIGVELDLEDALDARFLVDYLATKQRGRWVRACLMLGYLVSTGKITIKEDGANSTSSAAEAVEELVARAEAESDDDAPKQRGGGIGNSLFGIK